MTIKVSKGLQSALGSGLRAVDQAAAPDLGKASGGSTESGKQEMLRILRKQQNVNASFLWVALVLLVILFGVGGGLIYLYREQPGVLTVILGGNLFTLLAVIDWLRRLWRDKSVLDALLFTVSGMAPEDAIKVISTFYFRMRSGQGN